MEQIHCRTILEVPESLASRNPPLLLLLRLLLLLLLRLRPLPLQRDEVAVNPEK